MESPTVLYERDGRLARITLTRPERLQLMVNQAYENMRLAEP